MKPLQIWLLFIVIAFSECKLYEVDYYKLMKLCKKNVQVNMLYSKVLEVVYVLYERRLIELISLDAKGRYLALQKQIPNVLQDKIVYKD